MKETILYSSRTVNCNGLSFWRSKLIQETLKSDVNMCIKGSHFLLNDIHNTLKKLIAFYTFFVIGPFRSKIMPKKTTKSKVYLSILKNSREKICGF